MSHSKIRLDMKTKKFFFLRLLGIVSLAGIVIALGMALVSDTTSSASAKDKPKEKDSSISLKVISVTSPATYQGTNPYPMKALPGERLLAVTIESNRDFKNHIRSSEAGEVNIKDATSNKVYYTMATGLQPSGGPGKKPAKEVTFVFSVPQTSGQLTLNYGQSQVDLVTP